MHAQALDQALNYAPAQPNFRTIGLNRKIALGDLARGVLVEVGRHLPDEELPLDLLTGHQCRLTTSSFETAAAATRDHQLFTVTVNLAGLPGISVPAGLTSDGLPLGLQVIGKAFDEATVLRAGRAIEKAADFKAAPQAWWKL